MAEEVQATLSGFEAADKMDDENSSFFKPLTNIKYELTFQPFLNGKPFEIRVLDGTDYKDKTKKVPTPVLVVRVASIDGKATDKEYSVWAKRGRQVFQGPCESGAITKKKFSFKIAEDRNGKVFSLSEVGDK
jgi:hypothetical protein